MQQIITINSPLFLPCADLTSPPAWQQIFGNPNPLVLEIGCGTGDFAAEMASRNPGWNYLALDFYNQGCLKTCKRAEKRELANIRIIRDEARSFIRRCLNYSSLRAVFINCPDPWPKRRQRKRRLVNDEFINLLKPYLQPGADFFFATDFDDYGMDVANMMVQKTGFVNMLQPDLWRYSLPDYPLSKYMLRFMGEGKNIYFIHYQTTGECPV
ncbi:MAG: tRNA (guanosine(46)-N7)-methyltransferase TrmB [Trichlorobacter sp.]|nr:tRNA (guanosine(46)-N7)-methyltransferase TrmB [Trichlorobacter sp.]